MTSEKQIDEEASHMARRVKAFSAQLVERAAAIANIDGPSRSLLQDPSLLRLALDELRAQYDELATADEELRTQLEEVAAVTSLAVAERERYRELFDGAPQAYVVTDPAGVIRDANRAATFLLSPNGKALEGRPIAVLAEATDTRLLRDALTTATRTGSSRVTVRLRRRGAAPATAELTCVVAERGERRFWTLMEVVGAPANGSERERELERRLRDSQELLGRERRIRAQVERNDRAKDRFIALVSRDLRGPIHAVLGWAEILGRETFAKDARERAVRTIERNARRQLALVDELLDISRITDGRARLEIVALDLGLLVRRVLEAQRADATARNLALTWDLGTATVFVDRQRMEQVVQNLLLNAFEVTPSGGTVHLRVALFGLHAILEVKDSGRGIEADALATVFELRANNDEPDPARNGIGLFVVRQLVEMQGGTLEVESEGAGRGSTFIVHLPARQAADFEERSAPLLPDSSDLEGIHVLLVEDEDDLRELIGMLLLDRGARVSSASDAKTAYRMFESEHPDVVLSDVGLHDDDGCDLVRRMRALRPETAAIAMSGFTSHADVKRALDAGFRQHLGKPVAPERLVQTIAALVPARRHRPSL